MVTKKTKISLISLFLLAGLVWSVIWQLPKPQLKLVFCNVGQGDAILVTYGNSQILIDGGPDSQVLNCLASHLPFWDRQLEMVVLTHPEADHFVGLIDVIERYDVLQFVVNSLAKDTAGFWQFRQKVLEEKAPVFSPQVGERIKLGPLVFKFFWPSARLGDPLVWQPEASQEKILGAASVSGQINDASIVLKLSLADFDALLSGDIGFTTEKELDLSGLGEVEVVKISHHGSKYSSGEDYLRQVSPELAVISVGRNSFGHPTQEVLDRLNRLGIKTLRTDQQGEIIIVSDGKSWQLVKPD